MAGVWGSFPGPNNGDLGHPCFLEERAFQNLVVAGMRACFPILRCAMDGVPMFMVEIVPELPLAGGFQEKQL